MNQIIITSDGLDKLKKELAEKIEARKKIAAKIERAKTLGDLSENFEYQEAKEDQAFNEGKIMELEQAIKDSVVTAKSTGGSTITLGSKVKVQTAGQANKEFTIVSFNEAEPLKGLISNESPIGQALLGATAGDKVEVNTPRGPIEYKILEVK
ncbi:MAG: transcription elongation factor GreA [Patescibacteria group bacterium]